MKIIPLKQLVEENDINVVALFMGEGVTPLGFDVGSDEYLAVENHLVKGEYPTWYTIETINGPTELGVIKTLLVFNLEEEIPVVAEDTESQEQLDEYVNTPVTAIVFHRDTLQSAGRETKRRFVTAYANSVVESFRKNFNEAETEDFGVVEIDWENRHIAIKSIGGVVDESDTLEEEQ